METKGCYTAGFAGYYFPMLPTIQPIWLMACALIFCKKTTTMHHFNKNVQRLSATVLSKRSTGILVTTGLLFIMLWLFFGSAFHYSETWQLLTNMGTAVITFVMVWLVQQAQTRKHSTELKVQTDETTEK